jgi:hypothetical protein
MDIEGCEFEIKDEYLNIHPTASQKVFLLEEIHRQMKSYIKRDSIILVDILAVHRLSRMWLELTEFSSITMLSHEDCLILLSGLKVHWSVKFLQTIITITSANKIKKDGGLIVMADHAVKAMAQVIDS